jgi:multiple sugar transport system permease protein
LKLLEERGLVRSSRATVGLSNLRSSTPSFKPAAGGGGQSVNIFAPSSHSRRRSRWHRVAIVFLASQRHLVAGLAGGAVKE